MAAVARGDAGQRGLPPVLDAATRVLILGSFPSTASLAAGQYYAHPRNHFWPLLGAVLELPLAELPYARRLALLKRHRIGLWDIIVRCEREGSADGAIRNAARGDIRVAQHRAPKLELVCFNGQTAAKAQEAWRAAGYATRLLPSSSPAYTLPFDAKLAVWRAGLATSAELSRRPIAAGSPTRRRGQEGTT